MLAVAVITLLSNLASAQALPVRSRIIRVLFVGNSYTYANDIPWTTKQLSESASTARNIEVEMIAGPGATLQSHWKIGDVVNRLHETNFDFVVLQEQSSVPIQEPALMKYYAALFNSEIKKSGAKVILFMTWPRRDQPENVNILSNSYFSVANEIKATVAPVGVVWNKVLKQNLLLPIYQPDGSHPSVVGSYIASCVFYSVLFGESPAGLSRVLYTTRPDGGHRIVGMLSKSDAKLIQNTVWEVIQNQRKRLAEHLLTE